MRVLLLLSTALATCAAVKLPIATKPHEPFLVPNINVTSEYETRASTSDDTVSLVLGPDRRNAGPYRGDYMYGIMWNALNDLTIDGPTVISAPGTSHQTFSSCRTDPWKSKKCKGETLEIWVERAHWNDHALRRLFIGSIAGAVQKSTSTNDNCTHWTIMFKKGIYCSVGSYYKVMVGEYYMDVRIESSDWGKYYCSKAIDNSLGSLRALMPEYRAVLGNDKLLPNVYCLGT